MVNPRFSLGLEFRDVGIFRKAVRAYSIVHARDIQFIKNTSKKVSATCKHENCEWYIYGSHKNSGEETFVVKTLNAKHQCPRSQRVGAASSTWIAEQYNTMLKTNPGWPVSSMLVVAKNDHKITFTKYQMYRAKKQVALETVGASAVQYGLLWRYAAEIMKSDPDSTVKVKTKSVEDELRFKRFYVCWGTLKRGFLMCRPMIFLDGCHLKTHCGGILLCAVGIDPNNCMFPFAYAIVEKERKTSWTWFIELLIADLGIPHDLDKYTFMSDKQKGLIDAVESLLPNCDHRFCVNHLYNNFKQAHRGLTLKFLLWKAAKSTRIVDLENVFKEIKEKDMEAFKWLAKRPARHWSKAYFRTNAKCDVLLNNMCEGFNVLILEVRSMHVVDMLEKIRMLLMMRVYVKRDEMKKEVGALCPNVQKMVDENKKDSMELDPNWNGENLFEVHARQGDRYIVHLGEFTCTCRKWQLSGIPCAHAISAIYFLNHTPEEYVDPCYQIRKFMEVYSNVMKPLHGLVEWPHSEREPLKPPVKEVLPGRPKKHDRRRTPKEMEQLKNKKKVVVEGLGSSGGKLGRQGMVMTCRMCGKQGHNKRGCPNNPKNKEQEDHHEVPPLNIRKEQRSHTSKTVEKTRKRTRNEQGREARNEPVPAVTIPRRVTRSQSSQTAANEATLATQASNIGPQKSFQAKPRRKLQPWRKKDAGQGSTSQPPPMKK